MIQRYSDNPVVIGAWYMCLAMLCGSTIDVSAKALGDTYDTAQIVLLRCLIAVPIALWLVHRESGLPSLATPRWGWQLVRGLLAAGANFGFFYGVARIELVTAILLAHISPVLIVLLSRPLLGEPVGLLRWLAVLGSFAGVVWVLNPDGLDLPPAALAILGSALSWALLSLTNRRLAGIESSAVLAFYTLPVGTLIAAWWTWDNWLPVQPTDWVFFVIAGCAGSVTHLFAARAYRHAPAAAVAPFEYTTVFWAALAGYLFWEEVPEPRVLVGGLAIIVGGYLALQDPRQWRRIWRRPAG